MQFDQAEPGKAGANHPLAERMAVIAAVSHNVVSGCVFGTFGVMLMAARPMLGVSRDDAWLGLPVIIVTAALFAPVAGVLVARLSLRRMLAAGALMALAAFLLLASSRSYAIYLIAYGALLGPAVALNGTVGTATLVTRWFSRGRGLALGLAHMPIVVTFMPIVTEWLLVNQGPRAAYLLPAALIAGLLLPLTLLADDRPPASRASARDGENGGPIGAGQPRELSLGKLLAQPRLWGLAISSATVASGTVLLSVALAPLVLSLGMDRSQAAVLLVIMPLAGIAGAVIFGWIADRLGGAGTLALLCFDLALLWLALLSGPGFGAMASIVALLGFHAGGLVPSLGRGLGDAFGAASFSRAFGLATALSLPLTAFAIVASSRVLTLTGTLAPVIPVVAALYGLGFVIALLAGRGGKKAVSNPA